MSTFQLWQSNPASNPNFILMRQSDNGPNYIREVKVYRSRSIWNESEYVESHGVVFSIIRLFK